VKAFRIHNDVIAADDEQEAIGTWAQYYERPAAEAGPVEEINPAEMEIQIENEDGTWRDGSLAEVMPADGEPPQFVAWGECDCCGPKT
jgi:hypothetical protein